MISKIHISPPEMMIQQEPGKTTVKSSFKNDQVVKATVLQFLSNGKVKLLIDGQPITAKTGLLLKPGEELELKVVQQKDSVLLKLLEPSSPGGSKQLVSLIRFLSKNNKLLDIARTNIPGVKNILQETALKSGSRDDSFLPRLIENNGMMWEKKMGSLLKIQGRDIVNLNLAQLQKQDLKGVLLNQLAVATQGGDALEKTVTAHLDVLENFQLLNAQTSESGRYLIPFPVFTGSDLSFGQLLIDTGGKKEDEKEDSHKVIRVSFLLNMTNIGAVRADFSILKKAITGRFLLENDVICEYMKSLIPELKTRFEQIEYSIGSIDCLTAAKTQIDPDILMRSLFENSDDSVLNIVI